jgi:hypothetical protein
MHSLKGDRDSLSEEKNKKYQIFYGGVPVPRWLQFKYIACQLQKGEVPDSIFGRLPWGEISLSYSDEVNEEILPVRSK